MNYYLIGVDFIRFQRSLDLMEEYFEKTRLENKSQQNPFNLEEAQQTLDSQIKELLNEKRNHEIIVEVGKLFHSNPNDPGLRKLYLEIIN